MSVSREDLLSNTQGVWPPRALILLPIRMVAIAAKSKMAPAGKKPASAVGACTARAKINAEFKTKHSLAYSRRKRSGGAPNVANILLKRREQEPYEEIMQLKAASAKRLLVKYGVTPNDKDKQSFHCWSCSTKMVKEGDGFRCPNRSTCVRPRIRNPRVAPTPLYGHANAGLVPDWVLLVRCSYALGCKLPGDAATHFVRRAREGVVATEKLVGRTCSKLKIALAHSEDARARQMVISNDVVEPDSAQTGIKKTVNAQRKGIHGRTLVFKGRFTMEWTARALPAKASKKGRGAAPERIQEVECAVKETLGEGTVVSPDGGWAFHAAVSTAGEQSLKGVNHGNRIFTPSRNC